VTTIDDDWPADYRPLLLIGPPLVTVIDMHKLLSFCWLFSCTTKRDTYVTFCVLICANSL